MHDSALLVINERARGAAGRAALIDAVRVLERAYRVRVVAPTSREALAAMVRASGEALVIAAGGDGTVNAVVAALPAHAALAMLPVGTANDFACQLGIPARLVPAAERIVAHQHLAPRAVDVLRVNGHRFCTVGGVGLVTRTTLAVLAMKSGSGTRRAAAQLLGPFAYKLAAAATIVAGRDLASAVTIRFHDPSGAWHQREVRAHALFVVNHPMCGGGLLLPTGSHGADGIFELGIVNAGSRVTLAKNFVLLAGRRRVSPEAFEVLRATEAVISSPAPVPFAADGELLATDSELRITIEPRAVRIVGAGKRPASTSIAWLHGLALEHDRHPLAVL